MTWAEPSEVIDHHPAGACGCGADLALAEDLGVARSHQQLEVPLVTARRVQHDLHEVRCGCGKVHVAGRPAGVPGSAVSIGPNLRALAVYLVFSAGRAPRRRSGPRVCAAQRLIVERYRSRQVWCKGDTPRVTGVVSPC